MRLSVQVANIGRFTETQVGLLRMRIMRLQEQVDAATTEEKKEQLIQVRCSMPSATFSPVPEVVSKDMPRGRGVCLQGNGLPPSLPPACLHRLLLGALCLLVY
jgi:hypothetical protein